MLESFHQREEPRPGIRTEDPRLCAMGGHAHHLVQDPRPPALLRDDTAPACHLPFLALPPALTAILPVPLTLELPDVSFICLFVRS